MIIMLDDTKQELELLMLIRQTIHLAFNKRYLSLESYHSVIKDIDDKIKELQ